MSVLGLDGFLPAGSHRLRSTAEERAPDQETNPLPAPDAAPAVASPVVDRPDVDAVASRLQLVFGSRFQVLHTIAIGGMATIFQLRHRLHGGLFVAKVLHPELAGRDGVLTSFRTEAIHGARLSGHPNAVPIFDFGELDGLFFILMPFIEGKDLDQILASTGAMPVAEVLHMASQLSSLLTHAESLGIVHCDVTPGNIRLDQFGVYRLLDFGISQSGAAPSRPLPGGTPLYASPEQLQGKLVDVRSDLYSLGVVLAEALTGEPIFRAGSMQEIKQKHLQGDWQMPASVQDHAGMQALLRKLIAVDPAERLGSAFELSGILDAFGHARPEFRHGQTAVPTAAAPARRRISE